MNAADTGTASLQGLPDSLKQLDVRDTANLNDLGALPRDLQVLKISGRHITGLDKLPTSLITLQLENTDIEDLSNLPPRVRSLAISGSSFHSLNGLPATLRSLTLHGTKVSSLKGVTDTLQELVLVSNPDLHFEAGDLPPRLTYLVVDDQAAPEWSAVPYLCALSDRRDPPRGPWPNFLSSLILRTTNVTEFPKLPSSLRALGLLHTSLGLGALPSDLESLDLTGYRSPEVGRLPPKLKRLRLNESAVQALPRLQASLEELDISDTAITDLSTLPLGLKSLVFRRSTRVCVEEVKDLQALERLDLAGSALREIGNLPKTLRYLNLRGTEIRRLPISGLSRLVDLDISGTPLRSLSLSQLPQNLEVLTLSEGQMDRLEGLPKSVRTLRFIRIDNPAYAE